MYKRQIGWYIIGILTLGIGLIFINPYRYAAEAAFYNEISGRAEAYYGRKAVSYTHLDVYKRQVLR